ncbi:hypothetical protein [Streptosporangium sp. NPDC000396]|uniref:hypothetical protein n=1 Tax=Streptosporangium sp. NPDC000396 TaxID=3366185 RepID=UPI0036C6B139
MHVKEGPASDFELVHAESLPIAHALGVDPRPTVDVVTGGRASKSMPPLPVCGGPNGPPVKFLLVKTG